MYLCYVDESGTPQLPGNTSHFVLSGIALSISKWKECDRQISIVKERFRLRGAETHTAWIARSYKEQRIIPNFDRLSDDDRRRQVAQYRHSEILRLQRSKNRNLYQQTKKFFAHTDQYVHLTHTERIDFLRQVADRIGSWQHARLFAECIDKPHFVSQRNPLSVDEQAFEQLISRLEAYLENTKNRTTGDPNYCLVVHDNNQATAQKHTKLMEKFHRLGTFWTTITNIIETPLFVDSSLTGMVQVADLCAYAFRRFLENGETDLFNRIFRIADTARGKVVGVRHFTKMTCGCQICVAHR